MTAMKSKSDEKTKKIISSHISQILFDAKRGFLQFMIISIIKKRPTYAWDIKEEVFRVTGGVFDIDRNNLYKKLRMLEQEGILKSIEKPSRHGANRKYYSLTPFGRKFWKEISILMFPVMDSFLRLPKLLKKRPAADHYFGNVKQKNWMDYASKRMFFLDKNGVSTLFCAVTTSLKA